MTMQEFRSSWASHGWNERFVAWCWATGRVPGTFRPTVHYMEYSKWIEAEKAKSPSVTDGRIVDQDGFTEWLWSVAEEVHA